MTAKIASDSTPILAPTGQRLAVFLPHAPQVFVGEAVTVGSGEGVPAVAENQSSTQPGSTLPPHKPRTYQNMFGKRYDLQVQTKTRTQKSIDTRCSLVLSKSPCKLVGVDVSCNKENPEFPQTGSFSLWMDKILQHPRTPGMTIIL